jgi:hypothetical protein
VGLGISITLVLTLRRVMAARAPAIAGA